MLEFAQWKDEVSLPEKPWCILGKGPSFEQRNDSELENHNLIGLNHVIREVPVLLAHMIDVEAAGDCATALIENCRWLLIPRYPHADLSCADRHISEYFSEYPVLRQLDEENRLIVYDLSSAPHPPQSDVLIVATYFGSEAAFHLLAELGVKHVSSLGIDGGKRYASSFADLEGRTLLANKQPSYNLQFIRIHRTLREYGMTHTFPGEAMKVFIGTDESQVVPTRVLEYTILKHASRPVEFIPSENLEVPVPRDPNNRARTGFSFHRFLIPRLCGFKGRCLYLDADMQVFADLAELWEIPFRSARAMCTFQDEFPDQWKDNPAFSPGRQFSVMMLNCEKLGDWDIGEIIEGLDQGDYTYRELMGELCILPPGEITDALPPAWNHLEHFEPELTKLIHYTVVPTQPWKNDENPHNDLWMDACREAVGVGYIDRDSIRQSIEAGHVKASLDEPCDTDSAKSPPEVKSRVPAFLSRPFRALAKRLRS